MKPSKITLPANQKSLKELNLFLDKFFENKNIPPKILFDIQLIVEEIAVNICSYAYPDTDGIFSLEIYYDKDEITLTFKDKGIDFDPTQKRNKPVLNIQEANIGGLGTQIVKKLAKTVNYQRINNENILKIVVGLGDKRDSCC